MGRAAIFGAFSLLGLVAACSGRVTEQDVGMGAGGRGVAVPAGGGASGEVNAGDAGPHIIPTKDGAPIGDCTEPTAAEQAALGCPIEQPVPESHCDAPVGTTCRYAIQVAGGSSSQNFFTCSPDDGSWGPGAQIPCGAGCGMFGANTTELSTNCRGRPVTRCEAESETLFVYPTAQQWLDDTFQREIVACGGGDIYGNGIRLELNDGCPRRLASDSALDQAFLQCLVARLNQRKWDCATDLVCANYGRFFDDN
jgi:hypothetical protein